MKNSIRSRRSFGAIAVYALVTAILLSTVGMMCYAKGSSESDCMFFCSDRGVTLSELMHTGLH